MKILVLEAQTLHLGHLGCYGSEWADTPALDRLAAEGVVFDQHFADHVGASAPAGWAGRWAMPSPEGDTGDAGESLPALLKAGAVAFRFVCEADPDLSGDAPLPDRWSAVFESALAALESVEQEERWLVWVELPSLIPPWRVLAEELERWLPPPSGEDEVFPVWLAPPCGVALSLEEEERDRLQATFTALVSRLDLELAAFREALDESGWLDQATLWFTARTGLPLGEHGVVGAAAGRLHEELVHLPLLVRLPDLAQAGRRVPALTQPVDLVPTLLESFALPLPADLHGHSLWPLVRGEREQVRAYACAAMQQDGRIEWLLRSPEWAFLLTAGAAADEPASEPQLFLKPEDRWEVNNLLQHYQPWAEHLERTLRAFVAATHAPGPLQPPPLSDPETILAANAAEGGTPQ